MLKGRTDAQKELAVKKLTEALKEAIGASDTHISVSVEDYTAEQWQDVFKKEIAENPHIMKKPCYDPKDLL
jgi:phenylpyruvate tautomerase PptA (4-oxalocrotonate tautomerase family)